MYRTTWPRANERESLRKRKHGIDERGQARISMPSLYHCSDSLEYCKGTRTSLEGVAKNKLRLAQTSQTLG